MLLLLFDTSYCDNETSEMYRDEENFHDGFSNSHLTKTGS